MTPLGSRVTWSSTGYRTVVQAAIKPGEGERPILGLMGGDKHAISWCATVRHRARPPGAQILSTFVRYSLTQSTNLCDPWTSQFKKIHASNFLDFFVVPCVVCICRGNLGAERSAVACHSVGALGSWQSCGPEYHLTRLTLYISECSLLFMLYQEYTPDLPSKSNSNFHQSEFVVNIYLAVFTM
jgi:hypothetical protein